MKNIIRIPGLFIFIFALTLTACDNEPVGGFGSEEEGATTTNDACEAAVDFALAVEIAYNNDITNTDLCNAYKSALQNQISACGDDNGSIQSSLNALGDCSGTTTDDDIVGSWLLTTWNGDQAIDLNNDGTESVNFLDELDCYTNETIVFNADNSGTIMSTSYASFSFEIEAGTTDSYIYIVDCVVEIENTDILWVQSGNTIFITDTTTSAVSEWTLNGTELSTLVPDGFFAINIDDSTVTVSQDLTFVYEKQ